LELKYKKLLSSFAFNFNLRPYNLECEELMAGADALPLASFPDCSFIVHLRALAASSSLAWPLVP